MLLTNYTSSRANRLARLSVSDIKEPFKVKILWLEGISFETGKKLISTKQHRHSFFESHFIICGSMVYETEKGEKYMLREGEGIVFSPQSLHTVKSISDDLVKISLAFLPEENSFFNDSFSGCNAFNFLLCEKMIASFDEILLEGESGSIFSETIIKNRIFDVLCSMVRLFSVPEKTSKQQNCDDELRIEMIKRYINDNINTFLTCNDIAGQFHFNNKYLGRLFKEKTGKTLLEYIHEMKMQEAEKLLSQSELPLSRISEKLGFANEYYFNTFFRRNCGMTPGLFRKLSKKN